MSETVNTGSILTSDGKGGYSKFFTDTMTDLVKLSDGSTLTKKLEEIDGKLPITLTSGSLPNTLQSGRMLVKGSDFYCGNSASNPSQLALKSMIPDVSGFATSADLNSLKSSVSSGKSLVAAAVTGKGVNTAADASFQAIANNIGNINTEKTYGTFRYYKSLDTNTYYVGRTIYLSAVNSLIASVRSEYSHSGPGYVLLHDPDSDNVDALYRNSSGELVVSQWRTYDTTDINGPYTDGTFFSYYRNYYYQYKVDSNGFQYLNRSSDSSSFSNGKTKYPQTSLDFSGLALYGGSSKIDKSFTICTGRFGNSALPVILGDASSDNRRYNNFNSNVIPDYNNYPGFIHVHLNNTAALYQYDSIGSVVPCGTIYMESPNLMNGSGTWPIYTFELPYKAKILENNGSSLLLQNLGPA